MSPKMVDFESKKHKVKVVQISSGYEHTTCLLDNREILWFGQNNSMKMNSKPRKVNIHESIPEIFPPQNASISSVTNQQTDFAIVKIHTTWNR